MEIFSYSRLSKYQDCPGAFYRRYVQSVQEPHTEPLLLGSASHSVIQAAIVMDRQDEWFFKVMSGIIAGSLGVNSDELFKMTFQEAVFKRFQPGIKVEDYFCRYLDDNPFVPQLQGYIDLWRDAGEFVDLSDWKTNRIPYRPLDTKQLGLYAWQLNQATGKRVKGTLVFLRTGEEFSHDYTSVETDEARQWALTVAQDIQEKLYRVSRGEDHGDLFPSTPGDACRYCGFASECIDGRLYPVPGEVRTPQEAEFLAREIFRLESALTQMKDSLKTYVKNCGPVVVDKRQFTMSQSTWWKWNRQAVSSAIDKIQSMNLDPNDYLSLSAYHLKRLGWTDAEIKALGAVQQVSWRFGDTSLKEV